VLINWAWEYFRFERAARLIYPLPQAQPALGTATPPPGEKVPAEAVATTYHPN